MLVKKLVEVLAGEYAQELEKLPIDYIHSQGPIEYQPFLYYLVRTYRPKFVFETGVRSGISTLFLLKALCKNGIGDLISCDPCYPNQCTAERVIEQRLKVLLPTNRWLFYGITSRELADIYKDCTFDMFIHDSDHGEDNMRFELEWAWERLNPGGLLICDDFESCRHAQKHTVFQDFAAKLGQIWQTVQTAAILRK